jgi:hypothetical protein
MDILLSCSYVLVCTIIIYVRIIKPWRITHHLKHTEPSTLSHHFRNPCVVPVHRGTISASPSGNGDSNRQIHLPSHPDPGQAS